MMKAVIFDMDGVIIDSEPIHLEIAYQVSKKIGMTCLKKDFEKFIGVSNKAMWEELIDKFKFEKNIDEILKIHREMTFSIFREKDLKEINGIKELLESLRENNLPCAVASSSPLELIEIIIEKLDIKKYMRYYISGESLSKSKPNPMIFFKVAQKLKVKPQECLVIEDSKHGVQAAKRAGMQCIGFINPNSGNQDLSKADYICNDIKELSYSKIKYI
jgi:HAD superfamily hydrolase (TIGR01509 family)